MKSFVRAIALAAAIAVPTAALAQGAAPPKKETGTTAPKAKAKTPPAKTTAKPTPPPADTKTPPAGSGTTSTPPKAK